MSRQRMKKGSVAALALVVAATLYAGRASADHVPLVVVGQGHAYFEDFDAGDGGWTAVAYPPQSTTWEWGQPTSGPSTTPGDGLWATKLSGNHLTTECGWVESAPIALSLVSPNGMPVTRAVLHWEQWYRSFGSTTTAANGGVVQIGAGGTYTNVVPAGGYSGLSFDDLDYCLEHISQGTGTFAGALDQVGDPLYAKQADVSALLGETVTLRFVFAARSPTPFGGSGPGWYVDDVRIELFTYLGTPHLP